MLLISFDALLAGMFGGFSNLEVIIITLFLVGLGLFISMD